MYVFTIEVPAELIEMFRSRVLSEHQNFSYDKQIFQSHGRVKPGRLSQMHAAFFHKKLKSFNLQDRITPSLFSQ